MTVEGYRIETSLAAGRCGGRWRDCPAMVLWGLLRFLLRIPSHRQPGNRARRRAKGFAAVSRGMVAVGAGDPRSAKRHADDASRLLGDEPLALLLKAQAAQMTGDRVRGRRVPADARRAGDARARPARPLRGGSPQGRPRGRPGLCRRGRPAVAPVSWAGEALLEFQCADGDWTGALDHAGARSRRGRQGHRQAPTRRAAVGGRNVPRGKGAEAALARAQEAMKLATDLVPAAALAARLLSRRGDLRKASQDRRDRLEPSPHPDLAEAYMNVRPGNSALDRLKRAERLLSLRPHAAEGRIAVATAAIGARDAARARDALEPLLEADPSLRPRLPADGGSRGDETGAKAACGNGSPGSRAPRDPAWIADGVISDRWAPVSPITGRLDAFAGVRRSSSSRATIPIGRPPVIAPGLRSPRRMPS